MVGVLLFAYITVNLFLKCQGQTIHQAKIFSENTEVPEGGRLEVTCSTFGFTVKAVYSYLCKNGKAILMKKGTTRQDTTFKIERIEMNASGNYSCVFSEEQLEITKVSGYGQNYIFINVIESFIYAQIHLLKPEVPVGSDAEFNCSTSKPLNKNQSKNMILAYLIKNGTPVEVNIWDTEKMMTTFTLRDVRIEDAGTYSCVILLNILPYHGMRLHQNITVNLEITVNSSINKVIIVTTCSIIVLLFSLFLGIWALIRKRGCLRINVERSSNNETELRGTEIYYEEVHNPHTSDTGDTQHVVWSASEFADSSESDEDYNDVGSITV
ncbi:uncharacterized protein LOC113061853 [Carassius auratus]|uniref:Uncharacterized protein LOC113061853 n=1 Tax=Carassius auratus TaxID=7957 RepID=A0A6P6LUJ8_CARAU|nr:uncharacterized protein LOC113061853 [Carassius auratus]